RGQPGRRGPGAAGAGRIGRAAAPGGWIIARTTVLEQLTIQNFAIIDRLEVAWQAGLNVITGETGAGKSIIIDAVGALLGDRLGPEVVRSGAARALIEGVFVLDVQPSPELQAVLDEYGLEPEDGALIVSRELAGSS